MVTVKHITAKNVYVVSFRNGLIWDTDAVGWAIPSTADWADYDIPMVEVSTTGIYAATMPDNAGGCAFDKLIFYEQVGGTPAPSDTMILENDWIGWPVEDTDGVYFDGRTAISGVGWPNGTRQFPVNNYGDVHDLLSATGMKRVYVLPGNSWLSVASNCVDGLEIVGLGDRLFCQVGCSTLSTGWIAKIENCYVSLDSGCGVSELVGCYVDSCPVIKTRAVECEFSAAATLTPGWGENPHFVHCRFLPTLGSSGATNSYGATFSGVSSTGLINTITFSDCEGWIRFAGYGNAAGIVNVFLFNSVGLKITGVQSSHLFLYRGGFSSAAFSSYIAESVSSPEVLNVFTFNDVTLEDGAITASKFDQSTAFPLSANSSTLATDASIQALSPLLLRIHDALVKSTSIDLTGVISSDAHNASAYGTSNVFGDNGATIDITNCSGYCSPGYFGALYFTLSAPLTAADLPVPSAVLRLVNGGYSSGQFGLELDQAIAPVLPYDLDYGSRTKGSLETVSFSGAGGEVIEYDAVNLVNELLGTLGPEDEVAHLCFLLSPNSSAQYIATKAHVTYDAPSFLIDYPLVYTGDGAMLTDPLIDNESIIGILKMISAMMLGNTDGGGTTVHTFSAIDGSKVRVTATVTPVGNRTIVLDPD